MGIVSSTPTGPIPAAYYNPYTPPVNALPQPSPSEPQEPSQADDEINAEARTSSLLRRSRGRLGTVLTSFRGFLNPTNNDAGSKRKTLLGE